MKRFILFLSLITCVLPLGAQGVEGVYKTENTYNTNEVVQPKSRIVKNVILMIGDGMGLEQVSCAFVANKGKLNMFNMPFTGFQRTYSLSNLITDSAAAGTALATGTKTYNGAIAVDIEGIPLESLIDVSRNKGMKTGIVTTCRIVDATPSVFSVNYPTRDSLEQIAALYAHSKIDFIAGGGSLFFTRRKDGRNILAEMGEKGYHWSTDMTELSKAELPYIGLFAPLELPIALERGHQSQEIVSKALELLDCEEGFFMMVEGSCIDDWCHNNRIDNALEEILDFDRVLGDILKWAEADGETLVVVTADHSTGALSLNGGDLQEGIVEVHFHSNSHNGIITPVYAFGPQGEKFIGQYENCELSDKIKTILED